MTVAPELEEARKTIAELKAKLPAFPTTLVLQERPERFPRETHLHHRGEFLQPRDKVAPGVPEVLHPLPQGASLDRLTFARWLVDRRNPLVARVTMNRQWAAFFGRGLVRTIEDFGTQGELPTHPDLLDWLAWSFVRGQYGKCGEYGQCGKSGPTTPQTSHTPHTPHTAKPWALKPLHRLILLSATYQNLADPALPPAASPSVVAIDMDEFALRNIGNVSGLLFASPEATLAGQLRTIFGLEGTPVLVGTDKKVQSADHTTDGLATVLRFKVKIQFLDALE